MSEENPNTPEKAEKITKVHYNWRQCGKASGEWGDDYDYYEVGRANHGSEVTKIAMNTRTQVFVYYENGERILQGNLNAVFFANDNEPVSYDEIDSTISSTQ